MIILMQQIVAGVRLRLRRVGDIALPDVDIETVINRLLLGYLHQLGMAGRNRTTKVADVDFSTDDNDFIVSLGQTVPDFEAQRLERVSVDAVGAGENWHSVAIVPLQAWEQHCNNGYIAATFYGPDRVRLNITATEVAQFRWKLTYREPLLTMVQTGEKPPLPATHVPMLECEAAIGCMPLVNSDADVWITWMERTLKQYVVELGRDREGKAPATGLRAKWREYLDNSVEPQIQDVKRFDNYRRGSGSGHRGTRGFLPIGGN